MRPCLHLPRPCQVRAHLPYHAYTYHAYPYLPTLTRYVLTYLADLQWCHVAPLRENGVFGPKPSQASQPNPAPSPDPDPDPDPSPDPDPDPGPDPYPTPDAERPPTLSPIRRVIAPRAAPGGCSSRRTRAARSMWARGGAT